MKVVAISDTHNRHNHLTLPEGDLLIHAGDLTSVGHKHEVKDILNWFIKVSNKYTYGVVFIAGNHDRSFDPKFNIETVGKPTWLLELLNTLPSNIHYLENNSVNINGVNVWGSPITPWFHGDRWAFNKHRGDEIREVWDTIPTNADIIVTHGPVAYKCDYTWYDKLYVGCEDLRKKCDEIKPILHIGGHIHEGYGIDYNLTTTFINPSICNLNYDPINKPIEIKINLERRDTDVDL